jgi:Asp-tRNA(Asn)/Glu-tRNA(Gln) amidotransferase B subunit
MGSLAWPAAVVTAVIVLRHALRRLIPDLNQLKYKDLEIRFGRQLENVRHELESRPRPALPPAAEDEAKQRTEAAGLAQYFESIAEVSPRAAILEAWIGFETTATSTAQKFELVPSDRPTSMFDLIRALQGGEFITADEARALTKLRALRNEVVHAPYIQLTKEKAGEYASLVREIGEEIAGRAWQRMPKNC